MTMNCEWVLPPGLDEGTRNMYFVQPRTFEERVADILADAHMLPHRAAGEGGNDV